MTVNGFIGETVRCDQCGKPYKKYMPNSRICNNCQKENHKYIDRKRVSESKQGYYNPAYVSRGIRYVSVLSCPKDDVNDIFPPFTEQSKFPYDQFVVGLRSGVWPVGMKIALDFFVAWWKDGKRVERRTRREFIVSADQKKMAQRLEEELRKWMKEE